MRNLFPISGSKDSETSARACLAGASPSDGLREATALAEKALGEEFRSGTPTERLIAKRSTLVDEILQERWATFGFDEVRGLCLVAVGGYGRAELHPHSDIDLLILCEPRARTKHSGAIKAFIASLWDTGLAVGSSVRTLRECASEARRDVTVMTNLIESRRITGLEKLFDSMRERTSPRKMWSSRDFFEAKRDEQSQRHHRFGDTAYNLEPNIKEGPGGLRDIQTVGWVAKRHFGVHRLSELVAHEYLTDSELRSLESGQNFLWRVRFALHLLTARDENRLLFDHQRAVAEKLGYFDDEHSLGVEKLMKQYYREVKELSRLNEMLLEFFVEAILHRGKRTRVLPLNRRFQSVNGYLEAKRDNVFRRYPFALLEMFLILQQHPELEGVRASTIRLVRDSRHLIDGAFREDLRARSLFLEILRQPRGINHELHRMHAYGVLGAYLPVFEQVAGQMQYDLFHAFTVDEHSLFVVRNMRMFCDPERYDEFPHCAEVFARLPKPELLYVSGLFHDIAKGRGGDHSDLGADLAREFCDRHDLSTFDRELVAWLVQNHLVMSVTAQRRDITDPAVIAEFATLVGDHMHLDYLYLLTVADIRATNPTLWNDWKDTLLWDLYRATLRALLRGLDNPIGRTEVAKETRESVEKTLTAAGASLGEAQVLWEGFGEGYFSRYSADEIAWHTTSILGAANDERPLVMVRKGRGGTEIVVYVEDRKFLFAATTSILGRLGLNILDARILTLRNGMTLDSYVVLDSDGENEPARSRHRQIRAALEDALREPASVSRKVKRLTRRQLKHFTIPTEVTFTDDSDGRSVMEVIAADRPGLLSRIGWALADCQVRLQNAKVATFGERAEDAFFVTDAQNQPLAGDQISAVREQVSAAIDDIR